MRCSLRRASSGYHEDGSEAYARSDGNGLGGSLEDLTNGVWRQEVLMNLGSMGTDCQLVPTESRFIMATQAGFIRDRESQLAGSSEKLRPALGHRPPTTAHDEIQ